MHFNSFLTNTVILTMWTGLRTGNAVLSEPSLVFNNDNTPIKNTAQVLGAVPGHHGHLAWLPW